MLKSIFEIKIFLETSPPKPDFSYAHTRYKNMCIKYVLPQLYRTESKGFCDRLFSQHSQAKSFQMIYIQIRYSIGVRVGKGHKF